MSLPKAKCLLEVQKTCVPAPRDLEPDAGELTTGCPLSLAPNIGILDHPTICAGTSRILPHPPECPEVQPRLWSWGWRSEVADTVGPSGGPGCGHWQSTWAADGIGLSLPGEKFSERWLTSIKSKSDSGWQGGFKNLHGGRIWDAAMVWLSKTFLWFNRVVIYSSYFLKVAFPEVKGDRDLYFHRWPGGNVKVRLTRQKSGITIRYYSRSFSCLKASAKSFKP